jgi:hypothetical protein
MELNHKSSLIKKRIVKEPVVTRRLYVLIRVASTSRISEMVRLVDQHNVSKFCHTKEPFWKIPLAT